MATNSGSMKFASLASSLYVIERPSKVLYDQNNTVCCLLIMVSFF